MTKEQFAESLADLLKWGFPDADDPGRSEMDEVSARISGWLVELIDARIKTQLHPFDDQDNHALGIKIFEAEMNRRYEEDKHRRIEEALRKADEIITRRMTDSSQS